mmetsp:Transcript_22117/g.32966  ORF Transcript_22117/g.32966 Transcript_22117/m.32966 type:complete len:115 (+) Transcript_22117:2-346(+)
MDPDPGIRILKSFEETLQQILKETDILQPKEGLSEGALVDVLLEKINGMKLILQQKEKDSASTDIQEEIRELKTELARKKTLRKKYEKKLQEWESTIAKVEERNRNDLKDMKIS